MLFRSPCSRRVIESLHRCQIISRYGVGYDNVDVSAATENGILVTNVPDYCKEDVSDHTLALMLSCLRHVAMRDRNIRAGSWNIQAHSYRLAGKTLGVLGFGCIARALVHKCSGFGLNRVLVMIRIYQNQFAKKMVQKRQICKRCYQRPILSHYICQLRWKRKESSMHRRFAG